MYTAMAWTDKSTLAIFFFDVLAPISVGTEDVCACDNTQQLSVS